ncbi:MAG: NPCBM/NEW2 domain-containing protein [Clostridiales bacterium]|nr:NPCBM/NEW2 domain-containing protein [Clostridiales bacterium]
MKKFNFKSALCGFMAGVVVATAVPVLAYNGSMNILATFKNIKIYIDGAELTPRDASGNVLEPFIYNGSTYLPIRAVGEAVGKSVSYDANTNSVYLGDSGSSGSDIKTASGTKITPYQINGTGRVTDITMSGVLYEDGFYLDPCNEGTAYLNVSGNYSTLSGIYGTYDETGLDNDEVAYIKIYSDDILVNEFKVTPGMITKNFTINISGVSQLTIETSGEGFGVGFAEMYIK